MRLFIATTVCLLIISSTIYGQQIQPNPNPSGHTITVDTSGMFNIVSPEPFINKPNGTIKITPTGTLTNGSSTTLNNSGTLTTDSGGTLINQNFSVLKTTGY